MNPHSYRLVKIDSAASMLDHATALPPQEPFHWWLYRGMSRAFPLKTSLERILDDIGVPLTEAGGIERKLLKEFKRRAHQYVNPLPSDGDIMAWFALMQHHGAPTRLMDWTYSFYVAAFFALADATSNPPDERRRAVVWALYREAFKLSEQAPAAGAAFELARGKTSWQSDMGRSDADDTQDGINGFLLQVMENPEPCIWAVNAFRLNERLSVQQGLFLCPGDVTISFERNLEAGSPSPANSVCFEFSTEPQARAEMLTALHRMNINNASLFPGLDGFARSLRQAPWIPGKLRPERASHA